MIKGFVYKPRKVVWLTPEQESGIKSFLQGKVYGWCQQEGDKWFVLASLVGETDDNWTNTALIDLYNHHLKVTGDVERAINEAAKDAGALLMNLLYEDNREFEYRETINGRGKKAEYKWLK